MPETLFNADWVQTGELGIAFIALIALLVVIWYVITTNNKREERLISAGAEREERLMKSIEAIKPAMEKFAEQLAEIKRGQEEVNGAIIKSLVDRIEVLEQSRGVKPDKRKTSRP